MRTAIDQGINFMDNAWCYNDGESERIMGHALAGGYRDKVVLMTKNHGRDRITFERQLGQSLTRLQTDYIDVLQFHEIIRPDLPQRIFSLGAVEAAMEAREAGKIGFIGFTGHRWPHLHRQMLSFGFPWDTVHMPLNLLDAHFRSFAQQVLPILKKRGIGVIGMKSLASGHLLQTEVSAREAISYALSQPVDVMVSGMDSLEVMHENIEIARSWTPMSQEEQQRLLDCVAPMAQDGKLEPYKTD